MANTRQQVKSNTPLDDGPDWTFENLQRYQAHIERVANHYGLDCYPNQIEMITSEQMMDAYACIGMPIGYQHWSFGKKFIQTQQSYRRGHMGLAYEIVINSNPCIAYLMEENTMIMQALVIAHASYGHNSFFKGNYLFRTWTDADSIIDYMLFAKNYIHQCEQKHGIDAVEDTLDACHALMNLGVDRYKRPQKLSVAQEKEQQLAREEFLQSHLDALWQRVDKQLQQEHAPKQQRFPEQPQENLLYFIEKNAPKLETWQREIVRIVRKIGQYFYPQRQTQVMNEGWACFWHYTIINHLYDEGLLSDNFMMEFIHHHSNVITQLPYNHPAYNGINPYALGFNMFMDIRRICENPSEEDKRWFPDIAGKDWLETVTFAMQNFKDESFISQFLSPHLMREMKLFQLHDDERQNHLDVVAIHNEQGYRQVRSALARQYDLSQLEANVQIIDADVNGDRSLTLEYFAVDNVPLHDSFNEVIKHLHSLWQFDVKLVQKEPISNDYTILAQCPKPKEKDPPLFTT
ncbi:SpoVR family protein [Thalassotalea ponticola]|uniref:SpoVR family protein n=1 Tax=Thalassotalea ponticola TaxID=1523392 RepID=UPI0025B591B8|nr:SpoVR family protein [Thalassotalea ponticola]MDN3653764.1 SpoVR family protein [Thalassotalea ponticola]